MAFNKFLRLSNDFDMPAFGFRTFQVTENDVSEVLNDAIESGYRLIETSPAYSNQAAVGNVLSAWLSANKIKRDELFIVTKLPVTSNRPHEVEGSLKESLSQLKIDYVDLYLVDAPFAIRKENDVFKRDTEGNVVLDTKTDHLGVWQKMEELLHNGLTKAIGLGNFNIAQIRNIIDNSAHTPHVLQIEYHIYLQQPDLINFCRANNIAVLTYAALGAVNAVTLKRSKSSIIITDELVNSLDLPEVREIAAAHKKMPAQVVLRWIIDKKLALTIKGENANRIRDNINIFDFKLTKEEIEKLNALDKNKRYVDFSNYKGVEKHQDYPF